MLYWMLIIKVTLKNNKLKNTTKFKNNKFFSKVSKLSNKKKKIKIKIIIKTKIVIIIIMFLKLIIILKIISI